MPSDPPSAFARGQVRKLLAQLQAEAETVIRAAEAIPPATIAAATVGPRTGRRAALDRIVSRMPCAPLMREPRGALWRILRPMDGVAVQAIAIKSGWEPTIAPQHFGLIVSQHALHRLIDRSAGRADPVAAMITAHDALIVIGPTEGAELLKLEDVTLPGGGGCFLCSKARSPISGRPLLVARTWLAKDQVRGDPILHLQRWERLMAASAA